MKHTPLIISAVLLCVLLKGFSASACNITATGPTVHPCSLATACTITVSFLGNPGACNDNGTPNDPTDDFFTQNIQAAFFNRPTTGSLQIVPGGDAIGTYSVPITSIVGNSHIFNGVKFKADGTPSVIQMNFTDDPNCINTGTGPAVQPCSTAPACSITVSFLGNPGACNDNGTPNDPTDDFFTQNIQAAFFNRPTTGSLQIVPGGDAIGTYSVPITSIVGNSHIFNGVKFKADGTPSDIQMNFTDNPGCIDAATGPAVQSCSSNASCEIIGFSFANIGSCNDNGTPGNAADDFFTVNVDVLYSNSLGGGSTLVFDGPDVVNQISVPALVGVNLTRTLTNVKLRADGQITDIQAAILLNGIPTCTLPGTGPAVNSCSSGSGACDISAVSFLNVSSCNDNGTSSPTDDYFTADVRVTYQNPPATGNLEIELPGDIVPGGGASSVPVSSLTGAPHTFTGVRFKADGTLTVAEVQFSSNQSCVRTATGPTVQPCSFAPPIITCPTNVIVTCASAVPPVDPSTVLETHTCPGNVSITHLGDVNSNVSCINQLTITRRYQAADLCGNTVSCSQIITINDQTPPMVTCPANLTFSCASQVPVVDLTIISTLVVSDNCPGTFGISQSFLGETVTNQTCANRFTLLRTFRGGDACFNTATCVQTITVNDQSGPGMTCPVHQTVSCAGQVPAPNINQVTGLSDNCGGAISTVAFVNDVTSNQTCANRFTVTRTYRATDGCGNSATCSQVITVNDQTAPVLTCPANQTVSCANQVPAATNAAVTNVSDNCGGTASVVFVSEVIANQTCINRFTITRTWRATDACGNSATCAQVIVVNDQTPPVFQNVPPNVTVDCYLVPAVSLQVSASDNCGSANVTFQGEVKTPGVCPVYYILTRTWLATDACGNTSSTGQIITVTDDRAPQFIKQPEDVLLECGPDNAAAFQHWLDTQGGSIAEDCSPIAFSHDDSPIPGGYYVACGNTFQKTIRFFAADECGNVSFRDATFTVIDQKPPVFTHLPESISVECSDSGDGTAELYNWLDNQAFLTVEDQCGAVDLDIKLTGTDQTCANTWAKNYKFTATDECGNTAVAYATFSVSDHTPPVITSCAPNDLHLTCIANVPPPSPAAVAAHDQCGSVSVAVTNTQQWGNGCPQSPLNIEYTYTATDACGNTAVCYQQIRVIDNSTTEMFIPMLVELSCVDDIPGPYAVEDYLLTQLDGQCNATQIIVLEDLGPNGNTHSFRIQGRDDCRNTSPAQIVTFMATGTCSPFCTATSEAWGSPGADIGFNAVSEVIDSATTWYGGVSAGSFGRTLTISGSTCFASLVGSGGDCSIFAAGQNVANNNNGCQLPAGMLQPDGSLRSELGVNVLALQLNIWYNQRFNNRNLGIQDLKDLPTCMVDYNVMKSLGNNSTWQDLLNLANEYLGAANAYPYPDGFCEQLNEAIANVNIYHQNCTPVPPCNNAHKQADERQSGGMETAYLAPNPANDMVTLWYTSSDEGQGIVRISSIAGSNLTKEVPIHKGTNQLDLGIKNLAPGVYTVQLQTSGMMVSRRLVVCD